MHFETVENGPTRLNVAVAGQGPLILCVHGFPELWYSWRHQIDYFAGRGYKVAALDVRGYGGSSKPPEVAAYTLRNLALDLATVVDRFGGGRAILFGHDWGAPIAWMTALLHPDKVSAVALMSIPYIPQGDTPFLDMMRFLYKDRFFYQLYFQAEGVAEAELEADVRTTLRKINFSWSGDAPLNLWLAHRPADAALLDGLIDPDPFPDWMTDQDLGVFVDAYQAGGFRGPLNRYRAQDIDFRELKELVGQPLVQPTTFVAGERDPMRGLIPGLDLYQDPGQACADFRGSVVVPGAGHLVQQEAPDAANVALEAFVKSL